MIRFRCPQCSQKFSVPEQFIGQALVCQSCSAKIPVPERSTIPERVPDQPQAAPQQVSFVSLENANVSAPAYEESNLVSQVDSEPEVQLTVPEPIVDETLAGDIVPPATPSAPQLQTVSAAPQKNFEPIRSVPPVPSQNPPAIKPVPALIKPSLTKGPTINKVPTIAKPSMDVAPEAGQDAAESRPTINRTPAINQAPAINRAPAVNRALAVGQAPAINNAPVNNTPVNVPAVKKPVQLAALGTRPAPGFTPRKIGTETAQSANEPARMPPPLPPPAQVYGNCPKCNAGIMIPDAAMCVECGHNFKLGVNVRSVAKARKTGRFGLAVLVACLAALAAGGLWVGIVALTGYEFGWFATLVGAITGGAVCLVVPEERSPRVGVLAMGVALCGLFLGKVFVAQYLYSETNLKKELRKEIKKEVISDKDAGGYVITIMANEKKISAELAEAYDAGGEPSAKLKEDLEFLKKKVADQVRGMTKKERIELAVKAQSMFIGDMPFFVKVISVFGVFDLIWIIFAILAAYRLGSGEISNS